MPELTSWASACAHTLGGLCLSSHTGQTHGLLPLPCRHGHERARGRNFAGQAGQRVPCSWYTTATPWARVRRRAGHCADADKHTSRSLAPGTGADSVPVRIVHLSCVCHSFRCLRFVYGFGLGRSRCVSSLYCMAHRGRRKVLITGFSSLQCSSLHCNYGSAKQASGRPDVCAIHRRSRQAQSMCRSNSQRAIASTAVTASLWQCAPLCKILACHVEWTQPISNE